MTRMQKCIGLACQALDLKCLKMAGTVVLHQDVSKGVMVVTYSSCNEDLIVTRGFLGSVQLRFADPEVLQKATLDILLQACSGNQGLFDIVRNNVATYSL